ncbi:hypothetical protein MTO96_025503 [Rhipicephalus appendiculatus]
MGNLITTVGQDSGEAGTNQLLASTRNQPEARGGLSQIHRPQGDISARDGMHAALRRGRTESRQAPSPMSLSLGSRASLVPHRTSCERTAERQGVQARGHILEHCDRRLPNHIWSSRHQPRGVTGAHRTDERRMLARPHIQASAPEVHRPLVEHLEGPPGLPVDAVVNGAVPPQGSGGERRRSKIKRYVLCSGLSLMVVTGLLTLLTWSILEDPLGGDVERNASYMARLMALLGDARKSGDGIVRATDSSVAINGSVNAFTAGTPQAQPGTDRPVRLF